MIYAVCQKDQRKSNGTKAAYKMMIKKFSRKRINFLVLNFLIVYCNCIVIIEIEVMNHLESIVGLI